MRRRAERLGHTVDFGMSRYVICADSADEAVGLANQLEE
jgi:alkanesulfonate monooxygenase SsuD/methylene tetrahydromethanopterin reductase-like flavin-dependent oxidoreductase (luciferase family)